MVFLTQQLYFRVNTFRRETGVGFFSWVAEKASTTPGTLLGCFCGHMSNYSLLPSVIFTEFVPEPLGYQPSAPVLVSNCSLCNCFSLFLMSYVCPDSFELVYWNIWHRSMHWGSSVEERNLVTGKKTPSVNGGTQTQVLTDSMAIVASALNHSAA